MSAGRIDSTAATTPLQFGSVTGTIEKNGELTLTRNGVSVTVKLTDLSNPNNPVPLTTKQLLSAINNNFRKALEKIYDDLSSPANLKQHSYTISSSQKEKTTTVTKTNLKTKEQETIAHIAKGQLLPLKTTAAASMTSSAKASAGIKTQHTGAMASFETALNSLEKITTGLGTRGTRISDCIRNARQSIKTANSIMNSGNLSSSNIASLNENIASLQQNIIDAKSHLDTFCLDSSGTLKQPEALAVYGVTIDAYNSLRQESTKALDSLPDYSTLTPTATNTPASPIKPSSLQKAQKASIKNFENALAQSTPIIHALKSLTATLFIRQSAPILALLGEAATALQAANNNKNVATNIELMGTKLAKAKSLIEKKCFDAVSGSFIQDNDYGISKQQYNDFFSAAQKAMEEATSITQSVASNRTAAQTQPPDASFHALSQD